MATYVAHEMKISFAKKTKTGKASPKAKTAEVVHFDADFFVN
jgi:hypothetical protein